MFRQSRRLVSPAVSPLSPVSPRWLDDHEQTGFLAEPEEFSDISEKTLFVPILNAQPRRRDVKWLKELRDVLSELRSIFAAKQIGVPMDRLGLCLRPTEETDFNAYDDAGAEMALLSAQPVQPRLCWSEEGWLNETTGLIRKLLQLLAQKSIGMSVNSFLDFININNSNKSSYGTLSGRLDKVRNRLLCKRDSPNLIPYDVFCGTVPLGTSPNQGMSR